MNRKRAPIFGLCCLFMSATSQAQEDLHIRLESNFIGDKEQPSVSYFIPWEDIGTPDKLSWELDSRYDKTLDLVDRQVLLRATGMYNAMNLESDSTVATQQ